MIDLKSHPFPRLQNGSAKNIEDFFEKIVKSQFAHKSAIIGLHNAIMEYVKSESPTLFLRLYGSAKDYDYLRRGFLSEYPDKTRMAFCDNTFSMYFTALKIAGVNFTKDDLSEYLNKKSIIVSFGHTSEEKELSYYNPSGAVNIPFNALGWYQAHLKPTGYGFGSYSDKLPTYFPNPERSEWNADRIRKCNENLSPDQREILIAHFVRLIHPLNSVLVPKNNNVIYDGKRLGEETELLEFVRAYLRKEFQKEYEEFDALTLNFEDFPTNPKLGLIEWYDKSVKTSKPAKSKSKTKKKITEKIEKPATVTTTLPIHDENGESEKVNNLDQWLKSIGKTVFVEILYPELLIDENTTIETLQNKYEKFRSFETPQTRLSTAKSIFREGLQEEALLIIINSKKIDLAIVEKAQQYLDELKQTKAATKN